MEYLRVRNLRTLRDTGNIEIRPITILLGQNSSGKSTFLRLLPLLRQTIESRSRSPLLWFGRLVDFGSFKEALSSKSNSKEIVLNFKTDVGFEASPSYKYGYNIRNEGYMDFGPISSYPATVEISLAKNSDSDKTYTKKVHIQIEGHSILIESDEHKAVEKFSVNGRDMRSFAETGVLQSVGGILPILTLSLARDDSEETEYASEFPKIVAEVARTLYERMHGNTSEYRALELVHQFRFGDFNLMYESATQILKGCGARWERIVASWHDNSDEYLWFRDHIVAALVPRILQSINAKLGSVCRGIGYIEPIRATADRYYRFQDLAVDEIDSQGRNLPMFIHSLSKMNLRNFQEWTRTHFGFKIEPSTHEGHISLSVSESVDEKHNLTDTGFGYSQILPIVTQLWWQRATGFNKLRSRRLGRQAGGILAIEQPELHLHPRLQAQIADLFVAAIKQDGTQHPPFKIVAETHSEAIVNRLGALIAQKKIQCADVNVVLFGRENAGSSSIVKSVSFNEDGYLEDWPYGFFAADNEG